MNKELVVILPAYNEAENVEKMVERWKMQKETIENAGLQLKIVVVNDGSKDATEEIAMRIQKEETCFTLVNHEHNKGLGEAVKTGFKYVLEQCPNCEYACIMDCDNTQDPIYIGSMIEKMNQNIEKTDVVIASRYQSGAEVYGVAKYRLFTSGGARFVYETILRVKNVRDYTCGYRLYKRSAIEAVWNHFGEDMIEESGFTCMAEVLYKMNLCGVKFAEVPFTLHYDYKGGASKMKVFKTAINSLKLVCKLRSIKRK